MKRILLSILASGTLAGAMAVPAKQGLVAYTQPDGTVINIRIVGDEHGNMVMSEDGLLLQEKDGRMEYARFNAQGFPEASGIMVSPDGHRRAEALMLQSAAQVGAWVDRLQGVREERFQKYSEAAAMRKARTRADEGVDGDRLVPLHFGRTDSSFPVLGEQKAMVILVEYQDVAFEVGDHDYFYRMLNEEGFSDYGSLGSARDWFIENSNGLFTPDFDVYGPVKLPNNRSYYGGNDAYGNDRNPHEMAIHACDLLDEEVDFTQYDRDGDGIIDNIFIFYAGKGEHDSGIRDAVWPHSWDVASGLPNKEFIYDGVRLNHYACSCEWPSGYKRPDGIGTFVHEFSHVMGLPDLYNTQTNADYTPAEWSVMDQGPYNNNGLTPPNYSSYEKGAFGWIDFKPFSEGLMEIHDLSTTNEAYALPTERETEFFFFENRQQEGNDKFLPGHGMLVWHIDYWPTVWAANIVNNNSLRNYVDLVEADNIRSKSTRPGDAFPGTKKVTAFGFETTPKLTSWNKKRLAFDLEDIAETDGVISFRAVADSSGVETVGSEDEDAPYFDLMGRRVYNPGKGIYIRNGKKIVVK